MTTVMGVDDTVTSNSDRRERSPSATLEQLQALRDVVREGSASAAARSTGRDRAAVWRLIRRLELAANVELFGSDGRALSENAHIIADAAERVLVAYEGLERMLAEFRSSDALWLRIVAYPAHVALLATAMKDFQERFPNVRVTLERIAEARRGDHGRSLFDDLARGTAHLAVAPTLEADASGFTSHARLYDWELVSIGTQSSKKPLPIDELAGPLATSPKEHSSRDKLDAAARAAGVTLDIRYESDSVATLLALAKAGLATAIVPNDVFELRAIVGDLPQRSLRAPDGNPIGGSYSVILAEHLGGLGRSTRGAQAPIDYFVATLRTAAHAALNLDQPGT
jgi:DNA-binding transcriptional LysR family regulator